MRKLLVAIGTVICLTGCVGVTQYVDVESADATATSVGSYALRATVLAGEGADQDDVDRAIAGLTKTGAFSSVSRERTQADLIIIVKRFQRYTEGSYLDGGGGNLLALVTLGAFAPTLSQGYIEYRMEYHPVQQDRDNSVVIVTRAVRRDLNPPFWFWPLHAALNSESASLKTMSDIAAQKLARALARDSNLKLSQVY